VNRISLPNSAGIGLRLPHILEVAATRPQTGWLEIHPENFLANPHAAEVLMELSNTYAISMHSVGISVGSADGLDKAHLKRVRDLADRVRPGVISGHLAWSSRRREFLNDLLPLPYMEESLHVVTRHVNEVQDVLGRRFLIENPSSYIGFNISTMTETEFLFELVQRTGCGLLCDVSNIHVSAHNMDFDPHLYIDSFFWDAVDEIHLGGFTPEDELLIDTHAGPIAQPSWNLYAYAIGRFGVRPTLIERDNDIPPLSSLFDEARTADEIVAAVVSPAERALC
jgi:uncharacterized protein (UPF0276 family)